LRAGALPPRRHRVERGMDRPRGPRPVPARACRCGAAAGARSGLRAAFQGGFDARAWDGGVRLYEEVIPCFQIVITGLDPRMTTECDALINLTAPARS